MIIPLYYYLISLNDKNEILLIKRISIGISECKYWKWNSSINNVFLRSFFLKLCMVFFISFLFVHMTEELLELFKVDRTQFRSRAVWENIIQCHNVRLYFASSDDKTDWWGGKEPDSSGNFVFFEAIDTNLSYDWIMLPYHDTNWIKMSFNSGFNRLKSKLVIFREYIVK